MSLVIEQQPKKARAKSGKRALGSTRWIMPVLVRAWNNNPTNPKATYEPDGKGN